MINAVTGPGALKASFQDEAGGELSKAAPKIALQARRGLIAFLSSLGEQLRNDSRYGVRNIFSPLGGRQRLFGYVTMYPLHWIGCREGQSAGQHFVQRDPEGIQITA